MEEIYIFLFYIFWFATVSLQTDYNFVIAAEWNFWYNFSKILRWEAILGNLSLFHKCLQTLNLKTKFNLFFALDCARTRGKGKHIRALVITASTIDYLKFKSNDVIGIIIWAAVPMQPLFYIILDIHLWSQSVSVLNTLLM